MRPALLLRLGGRAEATEKPFANEWMGPIERRQCRSRGFCQCRVHRRELGVAAMRRLKLIATGEGLEYSLPKAMSSWGVRSRWLITGTPASLRVALPAIHNHTCSFCSTGVTKRE